MSAQSCLSGTHRTRSSIHSCAFFSRRLSPTKMNYDVGNHELLVLVLVLQNWQHWLEGSAQPFVDRPQEPGLSSERKTPQLTSGALGTLPGPVQLLSHLPAWFEKH